MHAAAPRKPRITLALLAYRQAAFVDAAVDSALAQVGEPIEVLLSDDASSDDTFDRLRARADAYRGPHQVVLRRNERNLGIGGHFNAVMQAARGELVVLMAADDISLPDRVQATAQAWDASNGRLDLLACDVIDMSHDGRDLGTIAVDDLAQWRGIDDWARKRPYVVGAGHALTHRLFDRFGPLPHDVLLEDQVNTLRAVCSGAAATIRRPLLRYRRGGTSVALHDADVARYVAWTRSHHERHLALNRQWLHDAACAGCEPIVRAAIAGDDARRRFMHELLQAPDAAARLAATRRAHDVALGWRFRKLLYWQWPGVAVGVRRAQAAWRRARQREG